MDPLPGSQGSMTYLGQAYIGPGGVELTTPSAVVGPLVTVPFTLRGSFSARTFEGDQSHEFDLFGSGTVTATFIFVDDQPGITPFWALDDVSYGIEAPPVPEPTSLMLLGSGVLGLAASRRSARRRG